MCSLKHEIIYIKSLNFSLVKNKYLKIDNQNKIKMFYVRKIIFILAILSMIFICTQQRVTSTVKKTTKSTVKTTLKTTTTTKKRTTTKSTKHFISIRQEPSKVPVNAQASTIPPATSKATENLPTTPKASANPPTTSKATTNLPTTLKVSTNQPATSQSRTNSSISTKVSTNPQTTPKALYTSQPTASLTTKSTTKTTTKTNSIVYANTSDVGVLYLAQFAVNTYIQINNLQELMQYQLGVLYNATSESVNGGTKWNMNLLLNTYDQREFVNVDYCNFIFYTNSSQKLFFLNSACDFYSFNGVPTLELPATTTKKASIVYANTSDSSVKKLAQIALNLFTQTSIAPWQITYSLAVLISATSEKVSGGTNWNLDLLASRYDNSLFRETDSCQFVIFVNSNLNTNLLDSKCKFYNYDELI